MTELPADVWRLDFVMRVKPSHLIVFATTFNGHREAVLDHTFNTTHVFVTGGAA